MNARDIRIVLSVVVFIGAVTIILVSGAVWADVTGREPAAEIVGLAGTALGYLGGLLTSLRTGEEKK